MSREDVQVYPWSLSNEDFDRTRNVYICVHAAVQIGCIKAFLEALLPLPDDIIGVIAYHYYMGGGTLEELETGKPNLYIQWDHPQRWFYKLSTDYKPFQASETKRWF